MFKPANELKKTITKKEIIDFLEDYIMEEIEKDSNRGHSETCVSGYSISVCQELGKLERGLHSSSDTSHIWLWRSMRDYMEEISNDLRSAGYKVYDRNHNGCIWVNWE